MVNLIKPENNQTNKQITVGRVILHLRSFLSETDEPGDEIEMTDLVKDRPSSTIKTTTTHLFTYNYTCTNIYYSLMCIIEY